MNHFLRNCSLLLLLCKLPSLLFHSCAQAKEIEVTKDWTLLGENDTIPAGMHVRMDMTTGEKWVKQIDENEEDTAQAETTAQTAVIQADGTIEKLDDEPKPLTINTQSVRDEEGYDYEMMHRTLSNLPDEEKLRMGGIPELPQTTSDRKRTIASEERKVFEKRMADIWEKRQTELKEVEEQMLDVPQLLKDRIKTIKEYLKDPITHLNEMNLDEDLPPHSVSHIVSVLQDLEYQLGDLDMSRDFHTLGGWPLLSSLVSENVHVPQNKSISRLSRSTETKIRAVQSNAAWVMGTAVKNTEEFFPFAVEPFIIEGIGKTVAIDRLIDVFCKDYKDPNSWEVRSMLGKVIYGIGSLLRGNRLAQAHIVETTNGAVQLGEAFQKVTSDLNSSDFKVIKKLLSLAADIVSDVVLHGDDTMKGTNLKIIASFSSREWCDSVAEIVEEDSFLPVPFQQTLLETIDILAPHCSWLDRKKALRKSIQRIRSGLEQRQNEFDPEYLGQMINLAKKAIQSLEK
jgi:nucleotide exchange factor SIL1